MGPRLRQRYRGDIDGLRAVAVVAVILFHAGVPALAGGFVGVDVFFVISGYLITNIIASEAAAQQFSLAGFYARRMRRILPALIAMLAATTILAFVVLTPGRLQEFGVSVIAAALMVANVHYYFQSGYFAEAAQQVPLLHTWSLSAEEQFYLLWPVFFAAMWVRHRRACRSVCVALFCASLAASAWAAHAAPEAGFYLLPTRLWELLLGALAAMKVFPVPRVAAVATTTSVIGLAAVVGGLSLFSAATPIPGIAALVPTCGALLIVLSGTEQNPFVNRALAWRPMVFLGLCSYSLYLWHWPLLSLGEIYRNRPLSVAEVAVLLAATMLISFLSWRYVELPFRQRTNAPGSIRRALTFGPAALIGCAALGVCAVLLPQFGLVGDAAVVAVEFATHRTNPLTKACLSHRRDLPPASACSFGPKPDPGAPEVVVWGDSHADFVVSGVAQLAQQHGFSGRQITQHSCPPLLGVTAEFNPRCAPFNQAAIEMLETTSTVRAVVLAARWGLYADTTRPDVKRSFTLTDLSDDGSSRLSSAQALARGLSRTVSRLRARGLDVLLVADIPEFGFNPVLCLAQEVRLKRPLDWCGIDTEVARRQLASSESIIRDVVRQHPDVHVVWPLGAFCDATRCSAIKDGVVLYRDDDHLNVVGAQYLLQSADGWFGTVLR